MTRCPFRATMICKDCGIYDHKTKSCSILAIKEALTTIAEILEDK